MKEKYGRVGVGVITAGMREIKDYKLPEWADFFVYTDRDRKGPAYARNQVLRHFEGYDYVFLFDDDCWPTRAGWVAYFIDQALQHGVDFMVYPEPFEDCPKHLAGDMFSWTRSMGCFCFQTKKAVEIVGGYNEVYGKYAYEDAARNYRAINKANLCAEPGLNSFPLLGLAYIYSKDLLDVFVSPYISDEDKKQWIDKNHSIYLEEIENDKIYYPFKEEE